MSKVSLPFSATSFTAWQSQLLKELKENTALLHYHSSIEDLSISLLETEPYQLQKEEEQSTSWKRMVNTSAKNAKESNQMLLNALMQGADAIFIENATTETDWATLLADIQTAYINCFIAFETNQAHEHFCHNARPEDREHCIALHKDGSNQNFISTFELQQIGANCSTELAGGLLNLHQLLEKKDADTILYFEMGIGSDYFTEIAKLRTLPILVKQLEEIHQIKIELKVLAKTGFCNKSLSDPYTNFLRMSTEGLSAVMGGAHFVCLQAHDTLSTSGASAFGQRMALNIGNLINEEAQLSSINDPLEGAYILEQLCLALVKKSWSLLCELDNDSQTAQQKIIENISQTRKTRLEQFKSGEAVLIGINSYPNEFERPQAQWAETPVALGLPYLIFEKLAN